MLDRSPGAGAAIRVVIVDPRASTRVALSALLPQQSEVTVVDAYGDIVAAMRSARDPAVDAIVIDSSLAGIGTRAKEEALAALSRRVAVVVMGVDDPTAYSVPLRQAGAVGYWPKEGSITSLAAMLRIAATRDSGFVSISPGHGPTRP